MKHLALVPDSGNFSLEEKRRSSCWVLSSFGSWLSLRLENHMWVWSFPAGLQSIALLGTYRANSKPLISLSHDVNMYIFKGLFIHIVCVHTHARTCVPAYVCAP